MLLFATLGYAARFGIAIGFIHMFTAFMGFICFVTREPTPCYLTLR
jgi:hypothetical protein